MTFVTDDDWTLHGRQHWHNDAHSDGVNDNYLFLHVYEVRLHIQDIYKRDGCWADKLK